MDKELEIQDLEMMIRGFEIMQEESVSATYQEIMQNKIDKARAELLRLKASV